MIWKKKELCKQDEREAALVAAMSDEEIADRRLSVTENPAYDNS